MAKEHERKFLVSGKGYRKLAKPETIIQGFLSLDPERLVRIRTKGSRSWMTVKGKRKGISRNEFEWEIPNAEAEVLLNELCIKPLIIKQRFVVRINNTIWEIDEFSGENEGLVIAETETAENGNITDYPDWIGKEVTSEERYYNQNLVLHPYSLWGRSEKM
ncbi:MAG: CYTH domain-containing protein [Bacteroidales bacterium]